MNTENLFQNDIRYFKITTVIIKFVTLLIGLVLLFFSHYSFIFYSAAMLPTVIAVFVDRSEIKSASSTICTFNLIGVLPYLIQILKNVSMNDTAQILISDLKVWAVIYSAALIGQFIYWIFPQLFAKLYMIKNKVEIALLKSRKDKICSDWSLKIEHLSNVKDL